MLLYYTLIPLVSILGAIGLFFVLKKFSNKKNLILKIISIVLFLVIFVRYIMAEPNIIHVRGINMYSPFGLDIMSTIIALLLTWFTYAVVFIVVLYSFFQLKNLKNFLKFFGLPVLVLDIVFFKTYAIAISGSALNGFDFRTFLCAVEITISMLYIVALFVRKNYFKITKKELKTLCLTLFPILIAIMPAYTLQGLIGFKFTLYLRPLDFSPTHRFLLYGSIIIPIAIYFALKDKNSSIKRFSLIYLSLATMWTFMVKWDINEIIHDPLGWPLHLCNTAMFIIPLCLVFKMNRLFYFTFFINVMGAFIAMIMPNSSETANVLSTDIYLFWVNHFCAFFMPVLLVALEQFERPKMKQWIYSMLAFVVYFVFILFINAWFTNYGSVDFFFLNSDFVVDKLGDWAENTRNFVWSFKIKKLTFVFYPLYQFLFFLVYVLISVAMWFLYEQLFQMWDVSNDRRLKEREYRRMKRELQKYVASKGGYEYMSENAKPCLELKSFSKRYGSNKNYTVKDVSLKVDGGTIFGFLGHNGAGKSTIIKSVVGIQKITKGSIEICGFDVEKQPVESKREIGFVPDHYALYENLTGREYINYIADLYGVSKGERDARIEKYLQDFQLTDAFDNQMKTYSHGMKQKITIMSALVHNPKVWILDEPLTGLDPNSIFQVKKSMKEHAEKGNIVFFSSHIIDVVERICDKIAIIKKGKLICVEDVKDLESKNISLEDFYMSHNKDIDNKGV